MVHKLNQLDHEHSMCPCAIGLHCGNFAKNPVKKCI